MTKTRLPDEVEVSIRNPIRLKGWEVYLFDPRIQKRYPTPELDYDGSYTIFPSIERYEGEVAIATKMVYPQVTLHKGNLLVWRKRTFSNKLVNPAFVDFINIHPGYNLTFLYFVPRKRNVEVHTPRTIILTDERVIDIDGVLLPYETFVESMESLQSV